MFLDKSQQSILSVSNIATDQDRTFICRITIGNQTRHFDKTVNLKTFNAL